MRRARFIVERHRFGATPFTADMETGGFIVAYLLAFLMMIGAGVLMSAGIGIGAVVASGAGSSKPSPAFFFLPIAALYAAYLVVFAYLQARIGNLTMNGAIIGPLRCQSTLRARDLSWLYLSNIIAVIATAGLAVPWVTVRMARYRARKLCMIGTAPLTSFAGASGAAASATGSEVGDLFNVDVSL
jgi:uncharacterized membrane protein YjgN (DUF898 family)